MMITPLVRTLNTRSRTDDLMQDAARGRRIAAAWAYKQSSRRWRRNP